MSCHVYIVTLLSPLSDIIYLMKVKIFKMVLEDSVRSLWRSNIASMCNRDNCGFN